MTIDDPERFDVAIAGASFAGATLAIALSDALGHEFCIALIDRALPGAAEPISDPRASALSASSRTLLEALGVWREVEASAQPVERIEITDSSLEAGIRPVLLAYDNRLDAEAGKAASHILPNSALNAALARALMARPHIRLLVPGAVSRFAIGAGGCTVTLADGRQVEASVLIGADGRASAVRDLAGIDVVRWRYPQRGIVTTVGHERPHNATAVQHFLPAGPFAFLPLAGGFRSCITWSENAARAEAILALDDASFADEVEQRFGGKLGAITLAGPRQSWPLDMHIARRYVGHRLALIGDAAHGVHPIAGQGLNLALRDVAALAECIADAARLGLDAGDSEALARYERWRRFDSAVSAATFDGLNRLFSNDWTLLRSARETGLGIVDRLPFLKRFLVDEAAGLTGELPRLLRGKRA